MRSRLAVAAFTLALTTTAVPVAAVEVGQKAPDFTLPSTSGTDVSLRQFQGTKLVLVEFYGADFTPT